ncbi:MAG: DMT family transporter [Candidatus Bipolaricaulota bacterium]
MRGDRPLGAYAALAFAMIVWGLSFLATKDLLPRIPVLPLLFTRFAIATAIVGAIGLHRRALRLPRREIVVLAGISLISPVGYYLFETFGVAATQASHASILIATIPIAVYLLAFARRTERATWKKTLGILLAFGGVFLLVGSSGNEAGASLIGDLLVLGAVVCAAVQTMLIKDALRRVSPLQLTFTQSAVAAAVFGPLAVRDGFSWVPELSPVHWLELLFLAVLCSGLAFLAMHYALRRLSATSVSVSANLVPVVTLLAEGLALGIAPTLLKIAGTVLAIAGVVLTEVGREAEPPAPRGGVG